MCVIILCPKFSIFFQKTGKCVTLPQNSVGKCVQNTKNSVGKCVEICINVR